MTEFLDFCHVCGHGMGSHAPICPKCFARSDPAAREAMRLIRQSKDEASRKEKIADEQEQATFLPLFFVLLFIAILTAIGMLTAAG